MLDIPKFVRMLYYGGVYTHLIGFLPCALRLHAATKQKEGLTNE